MVGVELTTADVNGIRIRRPETGTGYPIVLVHAIPTSSRLWRYGMPRLAGRALVWEMVGYGNDIPESTEHDISVAALMAWLDHVGVLVLSS